MTVSAFDSPALSALLGDEEVAGYFSVEADIRAMLAFEGALAKAQASVDLIPMEAAAHIAAVCDTFAPDVASLAKGAAQDGVVAPMLVKLLRAKVGAPHEAHVHRGATSQDIIDTSLILRLKPVLALLEARLLLLVASLRALETSQGAIKLMGRTRMQRALPIHVDDKLRGWRDPLERHIARLGELRPRLLRVQFGGAVGLRGDLDGKGEAIAAELARLLQLGAGPCWHVERDALAELASWSSLVTGSLGKIGADVALMAQNEIGEVKLAEGGGSSAMPHKSNPVRAEVLVTLARFNAALLGAQHQTLVHENERSGAAWTLEWLVLPQMIVATAAALRHATALCGGLRFVEKE
ncbi:3-carboxy-cis,cis-muconate cycloisomerase [Methylocapsa sp. S129]|uniref:3-carboxy-cis,cis-muconate cycloisomerase n=1 Tax=Methylocapsa sp. S129 TaxID=1641869 RepID=UPI00131D629D|nr:3-carboxy-cis,cis-muconate cycloisomerase [Methylocapsa sp. S129]